MDAAKLMHARNDLVEGWLKSHGERERRELENGAIELVGGAEAWARLTDLSRQDIVVAEEIHRHGKHPTAVAVLLTLALECELGAALVRLGIPPRDIGNTLERKLLAVSRISDRRLEAIAVEFEQRRIKRDRDHVHHGQEATTDRAERVRAAGLTLTPGDYGLLGRLAMVG